MASPVSGAIPTPGNALTSQSLGAGKSIGFFVDVSAAFALQTIIRLTTGASASSTSGLSASAQYVYGSTTIDGTTTNNGTGVAAAGTAVDLASISGVALGMKIALAGSSGELVTVSALGGGASGRSETISATQYAQANGSPVYLVEQTAGVNWPTLGQNLTAGNTTYSKELDLPTGRWWVNLINTDATNAVTVEVSTVAISAVA